MMTTQAEAAELAELAAKLYTRCLGILPNHEPICALLDAIFDLVALLGDSAEEALGDEASSVLGICGCAGAGVQAIEHSPPRQSCDQLPRSRAAPTDTTRACSSALTMGGARSDRS